MEKDEEILRKTRKHRKRKLRKESPTVSDEESLIDDIWEDDDNIEEEKPKRRGRKPREKESPIASQNLDIPETLTELQQIYSVVDRLKSSTLSIPFLDRPDEKMEGMSDYYEIITSPMWLKEIDRKYEDQEYTTATEVAADVRLMLENCYQYWGPSDVLTKKGLKLEQRFEQKLSQLSTETQKLCSLVATHGEQVNIKIEDESSDKPNPSTSQRALPKKGSSSRLLLWVISGRGKVGGDSEQPVNPRESLAKSRCAEREEAERELLLWETKNLITEDITDQIASMPEFPEIGQFLHLVYNVLNIDPVSHTELERMLLMPQASTTLATVITSMLIPPLARAKLEGGPAMPYSIWTNKLHNKVAHWYRIYNSKGYSTVEVFEAIGIEPQFWLVMGDENPLKDYQFHELSLLQRVWILKALCDFILHNHKLIQECINNLETEELREMNIGRDNEGYSYHYFPMFSEIRIYRMAKVPDAKWDIYESGVQIAMTMLAEEDDNEDENDDKHTTGFTRKPLHIPPKGVKSQNSDFKMVADSVEGLRCLVDEFCDADVQGHGTNANLVAGLNSIISQLEPIENKIITAVYNVRSKMREEWLEYANREDDYIDPGLAYWQSRDKAEKMEEKPLDLFSEQLDDERLGDKPERMEGKQLDLSSEQTDDEKRDFRERRSKRESKLKMMASNEGNIENSESEEEYNEFFDDDSSEEWHIPGTKPKKPSRPARKLKKVSDVGDKDDKNKNPLQIKEEFESHTGLPNISSSISITNNSYKKLSNSTNENIPVTIKKEIPDPEADGKFEQFSLSGVSQSIKQSNQSVTSSKQNVAINSVKNAVNSSTEQRIQEKLSNSNVIQTLVPYSKRSTLKLDVSKIKHSRSPEPDADIVYISDTEEPQDVKPTKEQLLKASKVKTLNYSMAQNNTGSYINNQTHVNVGANPVYNVQSNTFLTQPNAVIPVQTQLQTQQIAYAMSSQTVMQPNQILRPQPTVIRMQSPPTGISPNHKFVVIQPPGTNTLSPTNQQPVFINKPGLSPAGNNAFSTSPRMQTVNWYNPRNTSPISPTSPQNPLRMNSPRQRGQNYTVVQARSPQQSVRGRGSIRSPSTPVRMPRFTARTPNSSPINVRTLKSGIRVSGVGVRTPGMGVRSPGMGVRTPSIGSSTSGVGVRTPNLGPRTPTTIIRTPPSAGRGDRMRPGAIRNLNFSQTPPKQNQSDLGNPFPDIEGELKVGETDNGGFGYVVVLADGGKISLTSEQLAQIRSDNGGTLPKRCKVPIKQTK